MSVRFRSPFFNIFLIEHPVEKHAVHTIYFIPSRLSFSFPGLNSIDEGANGGILFNLANKYEPILDPALGELVSILSSEDDELCNEIDNDEQSNRETEGKSPLSSDNDDEDLNNEVRLALDFVSSSSFTHDDQHHRPSIEEFSVADKVRRNLVDWALECNVPRLHISKLLRRLVNDAGLTYLPLDSRTLLQTVVERHFKMSRLVVTGILG